MSVRIACLWLFIAIAGQSCHSQQKKVGENKIDRKPAVAGSFYPGTSEELTKVLEGYFSTANHRELPAPLALIVPHAGYIYSGEVAASAFKLLDRNKNYEHIFLIGSSHTTNFEGASIYCRGDFITPLGKVQIDDLAQKLVSENKLINDKPEPHQSEHGLEVQLPFLQYWLRNDFTIVPLIIGGRSENTCRQLAKILEPYFNENNLFIISSDFSHYPNYEDAARADTKTTEAIVSNSPKKFLNTKSEIENGNTGNLITAICGWTSVLTLLDITENHTGVNYEKISYKNSGDSPYGDKERVVGYCAIGIFKSPNSQNKDDFLNEEEKIELLKIARQTLENYLSENKIPDYSSNDFNENLISSSGAFVTLNQNHNLRGCIGNFNPQQPLYKTVQEMAVAAATRDPRFNPVKYSELNKLDIEISVLTPLKRITSADEFILGKHGIYIRKGNKSGTFLPQVADETAWSKEEFLGHCSQDKAGLGWEGWKTAELYTYEAIIFSEEEFSNKLR